MGQGEISIPPTADSINPEWLTTAFRRSGAIKQAKVVSIGVNAVAAGSGFVGQAARLNIEYDTNEPGAPAKVFAKLSSADAEVRDNMRTIGLYKTEAGFYRDMAAMDKLPIRVPRPYVSLYEEATAASILLIEDLGHARFGDNVAGCSPAESRTAVRQLALMHAHFWETPRLKTLKWLRSPLDDLEPVSALYCKMLPEYLKRWTEILTPSLIKTVSRFAEVQAEYYRHCSIGPQTLVHGDFRAGNFAFAGDGEDEGFTVFDWQTTRCARGARDLAYFMSFSMTTALRREVEKELLQLYYETLCSHGVTGYSSDDLARDFRCGLGRALSVAVIAGGMLDFSSEGGAALAREACERIGTAVDDHDFVGHLEALASARTHSGSSVSIEKHETYSGGYDPLILAALAKRDANCEAAFFVPHLKPNMHVLDCGCGPGGISLGLARLVPQGHVIGIDVEDGQLEMGRQEAQKRGLANVQFKHASVYDLPFEDSTFDAVLVHAMLYHLGEPMKALQELRRVLKPGGLIGVRDSDIDGDVYHPQDPDMARFWKLAEQIVKHNGADVRFGRKHRQILREAGFVGVVGSASSDSYGTPESTASFSKYWTDVFLAQHRDLILTRGWATASDLNAVRNALLSWGSGPDAFYSRCRCEAVGRKPAAG